MILRVTCTGREAGAREATHKAANPPSKHRNLGWGPAAGRVNPAILQPRLYWSRRERTGWGRRRGGGVCFTDPQRGNPARAGGRVGRYPLRTYKLDADIAHTHGSPTHPQRRITWAVPRRLGGWMDEGRRRRHGGVAPVPSRRQRGRRRARGGGLRAQRRCAPPARARAGRVRAPGCERGSEREGGGGGAPRARAPAQVRAWEAVRGEKGAAAPAPLPRPEGPPRPALPRHTLLCGPPTTRCSTATGRLCPCCKSLLELLK